MYAVHSILMYVSDVARILSQNRQMNKFTYGMFFPQNIQYLPNLDKICSWPNNFEADIACFCPSLATSLMNTQFIFGKGFLNFSILKA